MKAFKIIYIELRQSTDFVRNCRTFMKNMRKDTDL